MPTGLRLLEEIIHRTEALTEDERLQLIDHLTNQDRESQALSSPKASWNSAYGIAPYPLAGEDAQSWISRHRREADVKRGGFGSKVT